MGLDRETLFARGALMAGGTPAVPVKRLTVVIAISLAGVVLDCAGEGNTGRSRRRQRHRTNLESGCVALEDRRVSPKDHQKLARVVNSSH
jgi:hypothetical protein